jgi:hypothetical protein
MTDTAAAGQAIEAGLEKVLEDAFREVAVYLENGDVTATTEVVERMVAACDAAAGVRLNPEALARLAPLLERCTALAVKSQGALTATLRLIGDGTRANRAYREE